MLSNGPEVISIEPCSWSLFLRQTRTVLKTSLTIPNLFLKEGKEPGWNGLKRLKNWLQVQSPDRLIFDCRMFSAHGRYSLAKVSACQSIFAHAKASCKLQHYPLPSSLALSLTVRVRLPSGRYAVGCVQ